MNSKEINIERIFLTAASEDTLMFFPFFAGLDYNKRVPDLHYSYRPDYKITGLPIPEKFKGIFETHNIINLKDLLFFNYINFLLLPKINLLDVKYLQRIIVEIVLDKNKQETKKEIEIDKPELINETQQDHQLIEYNILEIIDTTPFFKGLNGKAVHSDILKLVPFERIDFSARFKNVLMRMFEGSLEDLLNTPYERIKLFPNCGIKSIIDARESIINYLKSYDPNAIIYQLEIKNILPDPNIYFTIESQFLNTQVNIPHIFKEIILRTDLNTLNFSIRFKNIIPKLKIHTVEELLNYQADNILDVRNLGKKTLQESKVILCNYIESQIDYLSKEKEEVEKFGKSPLDKNIIGLINQECSDRSSKMFLLKYQDRRTLEEVGEHFNLTRERARQIIEKASDKIWNFKFWSLFINFLQKEYLIFTLESLFDDLIKRNLWSESNKALFYNFWKNNTLNIQFDNYEQFYFSSEHDVLQILQPLRLDINKEIDKTDSGIEIHSFLSIIRTDCKLFARDIFEYLSLVYNEVFVYEDRIYNKKMYNVLYGKKLAEVIYWSMRYLEEPAHFTQLAEFIRSHNSYNNEVSDITIHAYLCRFDFCHDIDRGIYALKETNIPKHISAGEALCNLLKEKGPMLEDTIYKSLNDRYTFWNIQMALQNNRHKLIRIGNNLFDLKEEVNEIN